MQNAPGTVGAVGTVGTITHHIGVRIDIDGQTIEFSNNGGPWTPRATVAGMWSNGAIYPIWGHDGNAPTNNEDFVKLIFDPADFPQPISAGYSPCISSS